MLRTACLVIIAVVTLTSAAVAQPPAASRGPVFRVEPDARTDYSRPGFVTGWLYNDGQAVVGLVKMKVEVLDGGKVVSEHSGWAYGNVAPGGRSYFRIPVPPRSPADVRVTVDSYVVQSYAGEQSP